MVKEDGSIAARNVIARLGKGELRTDAALREQGARRPGGAPPFDTDRPEGPLHEVVPLMIKGTCVICDFCETLMI